MRSRLVEFGDDGRSLLLFLGGDHGWYSLGMRVRSLFLFVKGDRFLVEFETKGCDHG
ncbi:hypothetical protein [uncultured Nostoc sp.]|uniref:hypothetical protein n=1 Tax=uncultured Nostoc sp. TaxID=340711 RepID=UPI0035CA2500